jgi:hypothetical protein
VDGYQTGVEENVRTGKVDRSPEDRHSMVLPNAEAIEKRRDACFYQ